MENLKNNKKLIIICIFLVLLTLIISLLSLKDKDDIVEISTEDYTYLKNYSSNEYIPVYVTEEDMVKKYLNDFKNYMLYSIEDAYNSLNKEYREKRFVNLEGFKKYVDSIESLTMHSMEVEKYSVKNVNGNKVFNIYDKSGYQYIIKELSIMNYEVYLDEYTVTIK